MMDDDSCVMKYIEIVPLDDFRNCSDFTDIKQEPVDVKVCVYCRLIIVYLVYIFICDSVCYFMLFYLHVFV